MEAFSLLKYWKANGGGGGGGGGSTCSFTSTAGSKTILAAVADNQMSSDTDTDTDEDEAMSCADDGPFFDLEFTLPADYDNDDEVDVAVEEQEPQEEEEVTEEEEEEEQKSEQGRLLESLEEEEEEIVVVSSTNRHSFRKGFAEGGQKKERETEIETVNIEGVSSSLTDAVPEYPCSSPLVLDSDTKSQLAVSLLRSATKLRILMSGLKTIKPKKQENISTPTTSISSSSSSSGSSSLEEKCHRDVNQNQNQIQTSQGKIKQRSKLFTVKFKVEEVPAVSLFTKDSSSSRTPPNDAASSSSNSSFSSADADRANVSVPEKPDEEGPEDCISEESNRNTRGGGGSDGVVQFHKYLKMVKPLYVRVSKRYGDKLGLGLGLGSDSPRKASIPSPSAESAQVKSSGGGGGTPQKQNLAVGLRVMRKRLGKSKSASSAMAPTETATSRKRDDTLLELQDGIQGAILHCKRSLQTTKESPSSSSSSSSSSSALSRSTSDRPFAALQ